MRKLFISLMLAGLLALLTVATAVPAFAAAPPVGSCPTEFDLVSAADHLDVDLNGDGLICIRGNEGELGHVHVDNLVH